MQLATQIQALVDRHLDSVIDRIVAEYGSGNQSFTREDCQKLLQLPQKAKKTSIPKEKKENNSKTEKKTPVKLDTEEVSVEFCSARVWGSAKDGTAGLPTNQCKKKATNGCFCAMHFKKNAEQSPWHLGLITEDPPETDHKGKLIKWVGCVQIKKKDEPQPAKEPEVTKEPEVAKEPDAEIKSDSLTEKIDIKTVTKEQKEQIMNELFGSDEDDDSQEDTEEIAETETYVFDGKEFQVDEDNIVYEQDTNGIHNKVGILVDGELVRD